MAVSLELYRIRIGQFRNNRTRIRSREKIAKQNRSTVYPGPSLVIVVVAIVIASTVSPSTSCIVGQSNSHQPILVLHTSQVQ